MQAAAEYPFGDMFSLARGAQYSANGISFAYGQIKKTDEVQYCFTISKDVCWHADG